MINFISYFNKNFLKNYFPLIFLLLVQVTNDYENDLILFELELEVSDLVTNDEDRLRVHIVRVASHLTLTTG